MNYFEHFCPEHIGALIVITIIIVSGTIGLKKLPENKCLIVLRILSCVLFFCEGLQDILLIRDGGDIMDFLPLHLCNLGIFVNIFASFGKNRVRRFFSEISVVLIMPGALGALLFPDWNYRPFWSYLPMLCFFTHMLLMLVPIVYLVKGYAEIRFSHFWYTYLFMGIVAPPLLWFDYHFKQNYLFLRRPVEASPLEWTYNLMGKERYLIGLVLLLTSVLIVEYLLYVFGGKLISRIRQSSKHSSGQATNLYSISSQESEPES